ncbi:hypothetical protein [Streptomyces sp. CBMA152]|uniref:hypothetical protein n=1 Tax=Streptomyces sp. CBMA152 TaxID=1896312 RepID=UPI00166121F6|nr:hypothetical protein [Streptomyces sp. CBMA152]MBD0743556.1 hypothetical protein [Streptomyces sp. CBMA152]
MAGERCHPCEQHAELHSDNWFGIGPANDPCAQCEAHAKKHANEGCAEASLIVLFITCAAVLAGNRIRRR